MATKNITPNTLINAATTIVGAAQAASKGSKRSMNKRAEDKAAEARRATDAAPETAPAPETSAPATDAPAPSAQRSALYTIAPKAKIVANHLTLQRGCTVPVGAQWRANGHKAPNTRHVALSALMELGSAFTLDDAAKALKPLKDQALLGSGTPASYLKAFIKSGYLVEVA